MDRQSVLDIIDLPERLAISEADLETIFWLMYPRFRFLKTVKPNAVFLDIGASTGALAHWREWQSPRRMDIKMYGVDLVRGENAGLYEAWEVVDLDIRRPNFPGVMFDAFLASHLIEHISSLDSLLGYIHDVANPSARLYFEWPAPKTLTFPKCTELAARGLTIQTCNFFDDSTHRQTYELAAVQTQLARAGFRVIERGEINLGLVAEEMMARGRRLDNLLYRQMGFWAAVGWSNYIIAERIIANR